MFLSLVLEGMRIYQSYKNIYPKIFSVFPVVYGLVFLGNGFTLRNGFTINSYLSLFIGFLLTGVGIWTFFGKSNKYIDVESRKVISEKAWLFFRLNSESPLSQYKYISVDWHTHEQSGAFSPKMYDVTLVSKYSSADHIYSLGGVNNLSLQSFKRDKKAALEYANQIASKIDFEVKADFDF